MGIAGTSRFFDEGAALRENVEGFLTTAHELPDLDASERIDAIESTVTFLADVLLPHAQAEERVLYPAASRLLHDRDDSGSVRRDRTELRRLVEELVAADPSDCGRLQELLYAMYLLLSGHFQREDGIYLRLVAAQPESRVRQLFDRVRAYERGRRFRRVGAPARPPA
jgi:hemerythrin superfamily protein